MDVDHLIKTAKIGRERKDAQVDTCAVFAAALYDVLMENGYSPSLRTAAHKSTTPENNWYHLVVEVDGKMYDSMGEFSTDIILKRLKINPKREYEIKYIPEPREECFDAEDYGILYDFLFQQITNAFKKLTIEKTEEISFRI